MPSQILKICLVTAFIGGFSSLNAIAQVDVKEDAIVAETVELPTAKKRVIRVVEPVEYWVESDQLRVRDNPYAGDVVGMLKIGDKVKVHKTLDSWVLISANGKPERWVNSSFLSAAPVTWASYNFDSRGSRSLGKNRFGGSQFDTKVKRIKVKGLKGLRVFAADIKKLYDDKKLVISRHDYRAGSYFEKHLVKCSDEDATHIKILGEGYSVMMMEADPRQQHIGSPMEEQDDVESEGFSQTDKAIAEFTCGTDKL